MNTDKYGMLNFKIPVTIKEDGSYFIEEERIQYTFEKIDELPEKCELPVKLDLSSYFSLNKPNNIESKSLNSSLSESKSSTFYPKNKTFKLKKIVQSLTRKRLI